jgi:hypothetical protein
LNKLINAEKNTNKRFACVLLIINLVNVNYGHANILIYDYKNMTVERFDPYGNSTDTYEGLDKLLEEELTWNTGFKYIYPKDFLPYAGFQNISDEINEYNTKPGDIGGFCLAWCIWYLETKIKNQDISSKKLVEKLIYKLNNLDIKYIEYIRNYSNSLESKKINFLVSNGFDHKQITNVNLTSTYFQKILNFIYTIFSKKIN